MEIVLIVLVFVIAGLLGLLGAALSIGGVFVDMWSRGRIHPRGVQPEGFQFHHVAWILSGVSTLCGIVLIILRATGNM